MKKNIKVQRPTMPISLAPRKSSFQQPPDISPRSRNWQSVILKQVDNNRTPNSTLTSTMKRELKENFGGIRVQEPVSENRVDCKMELQSLREEVGFRRQTEEQLRREILQLKERLEKVDGTRDRYKSDRQKDIIAERINKLQQELIQVNQTHQVKEQSKNHRIQLLSKEIERLQGQRHRLVAQYQKLEYTIKSKIKVDQETQHNQDEVFELRKKIHEAEKVKASLEVKLKEKDCQIKRIIEDFQVAINEKELKYSNCLNQFKKMESKLAKSKEDSIGLMRVKIEEQQVLIQTIRQVNQQLRCQNVELNVKLDGSKHQIEQYRHLSEEVSNKLRNIQNETSNIQRKQIILNKQLFQLRNQAESNRKKYQQKCRETVYTERARSHSNIVQTEQFYRTKTHSTALEIKVNKLNSEILKLKEELKNTTQLLIQKDVCITQLQKQIEHNNGKEILKEIEKKYQELYENHEKIAEDYQGRIVNLKKQLLKADEKIKEEEDNTLNTTKDFDDVLRQQIISNECLKQSLRQKDEENISLRNQIQQWKRKVNSIKSLTQIQKLKGITGQKSLKCHYQIAIENLKYQLDSQQRKLESLQRKADFRSDELKKKDEFIQQVIIGKVDKPDHESEIQYLRKELTKFFSVNYETPLLVAQQRIVKLESIIST